MGCHKGDYVPLLHQSTDKATGGITGFKNYKENGIWQENRNWDAARGDGEQENGIGQENRNRDAARGTWNRRTGFGRGTGTGTRRGEQENRIWQENK